MLFGDDAPAELQARFKVVRLPGTSLSDNEIKTNIIKAVNKYFNIDNWEFRDTFISQNSVVIYIPRSR